MSGDAREVGEDSAGLEALTAALRAGRQEEAVALARAALAAGSNHLLPLRIVAANLATRLQPAQAQAIMDAQTPVSLLDAFDQPAMTPNCTERRRSNVATQALHMMNGSMTWDLARYMAGRVMDEAGADTAKQIELIYLRAFSRRPAPDEVVEGLRAIAEFRIPWPARLTRDNGDAPREAGATWLALANYCHALLNSAEFSFID